MVGVLLFFVSGNRKVLFFFPNVFDGLFVFFELYRWLTGERVLFGTRATALWVMGALLIPRWTREYFIHVTQAWPADPPIIFPRGLLDMSFWEAVYLLPQLLALAIVVARARRGAASSQGGALTRLRGALPRGHVPRP